MYTIPYVALVNDLSRTSKDRILLTTAMAISYIIGSVVAAGAPMVWTMLAKAPLYKIGVPHSTDTFLGLTNKGMDIKWAVSTSLGLFSLLGGGLMLFPLFVIKEVEWTKHNKVKKLENPEIFKNLKAMLTQGQFKWILAADFFLWIGLMSFQSQLNFIISGILGLPIGNTLYFAGIFAFISMLLYPIIGITMNKIGVRKRYLQIGFVVYVIAFILGGTMVFGGGSLGYRWAMGLIFIAIIAFPTACIGVVKNVIITDIITTNAVTHNEDKAATYWAVRNFTSKIAMAIGGGISIALLLLGKSGISWGIRAGLLMAAGVSFLSLISLSFYKETLYRQTYEFHKFLKYDKLVIIGKEALEKNADSSKIEEIKKEIEKNKKLSKLNFNKAQIKIDRISKKEVAQLLVKISKVTDKKRIAILNEKIKSYNDLRINLELDVIKV